MRLLHLMMIALLVAAAVYVYEIKLSSALQAERLANLRGELRKERDAIAALRAEWTKLDNPVRMQGLAQRHLTLKPMDSAQIDSLDKLPERSAGVSPGDPDPIGSMIDDTDAPTAGIGARPEPRP
ncbi:MAG: hypothetical protein AB7K35_15675 [Pseudorhodoplanes sp.]